MSDNTNSEKHVTDKEALEFHKYPTPGKVALRPTKPLMTQRDLSLAYSPGVAAPCLEIHKDPQTVYDYTSKGNIVAVISNGTAVLGLGNLGALASKPVMEGKAVLLKRFADIDGVDIEVSTTDPDEFINCVRYLGASWGAINLEDIAAPECFIIEKKLRDLMDIPVFHDDQHGTAIITLAALINASYLTKRKLKDLKIVSSGAGAASIACIELMKYVGVPSENIILCDQKGVIYKGRIEGMNPWKEKHAVNTKLRSLTDAMNGADVFLGLSVKGIVTKDMVASMAPSPIIFALANPDPEITPEEILSVRTDAIIATGRSDYNNQVNNVMGFPYIFRGALDVRASTINDEMKVAAANALAMLARDLVPDSVSSAYMDKKLQFGPEYIIPVPFDPRLITTIPCAVAEAAMRSGVARKIIKDMKEYKTELSGRLDPVYASMSFVFEKIRQHSTRMIFAEGEEESVMHAALLWRDEGYGTPVLVGKEKRIMEVARTSFKNKNFDNIEIWNAKTIDPHKLETYIDYYYKRNQRNGMLYRDCVRLVKNDRNVFASCMLACGDGDALITGATRGYHISLEEILTAIPTKPNHILFGISILVQSKKAIFISDTTVNERPSAIELADIATQTAEFVTNLGYTARAALLSFSNFGNPQSIRGDRVREAVLELDRRQASFQYEGEMTPDSALNYDLMKKYYPFSRLKKAANILIMPALHSANISSKLLKTLGGGVFLGPMLIGLSKPVQIAQIGMNCSDILNLAAFAALQATQDKER